MISSRSRAGAFLGGVAGAAVGWGWFEAGWVRLRTLEVVLPRLPQALAGIRVAHLSDFHFGVPSRGSHAVERAVEWVCGRKPEVVVVTGDLVSRPRGERLLRAELERLGTPFVVLGNHDVEHSRDPFSRSAGLKDLAPARLLVDESETVELRGARVQIVGVDPRAYRQRRSRPWDLVDESAELRILLCHFPYVLDRLPAGAFDLVLAGHMHDGQISLPLGLSRRYRFAHPRTRYPAGLFQRPGGTMHVSPGLGTSFVPFRFFARPEATELVLQRGGHGDDL
jgi:predicted MPP superfamily phosphohydrolase